MKMLALMSCALAGLLLAGVAFGGWWQLHSRHDNPILDPRQAAEVWALENTPARFRQHAGVPFDNTTAVCYPALAWPTKLTLRQIPWTCTISHAGVRVAHTFDMP
jgi:hypothetical protein